MAIAFDAFTDGSFTTSNTQTDSHTTSGTDRLFVAGSYTNDNIDTLTSVTYNGVSLTEVPTGSPQSQSGGGARTEYVHLHYLVNPSSGTNNCVQTATGNISNAMYLFMSSYTGVDQTTGVDVSAGNQNDSATSLSVTPTTTKDDCWAVTMCRSDAAAITDDTNYTGLLNSSVEYGDSAASVGTAGSKTVTIGSGSTGRMMMVSGMFFPASGGGGGGFTPPAHTLLTLGAG